MTDSGILEKLPGDDSPEPAHLFNRELSWLEFNARVLGEAMEPTTPLLDRLLFTGIFSSNLDEFFMVRVASLEPGSDVDVAVRAKASALADVQARYFREQLVPELEQAGIRRVRPEFLEADQLDFVHRLFDHEIFPVVSPVALTGQRSAPALGNLSMYMVVAMTAVRGLAIREYAVIEVPPNLSRMIVLPGTSGYAFILLEDVLRMHIDRFFQGYDIESISMMRLTRGAEMSLDEERDEDFAKVMAEALRERRRGEVMRLEVEAPADVTVFLQHKLGVAMERVYQVRDWFDLKRISTLAFLPGFDRYRRTKWVPCENSAVPKDEDIWSVMQKQDVLLHLPYESFDPVLRLVAEAADDPDVLAIKQTLYRTASDSQLVRSLERAAENGKRVTVLVELKARFDEAENIQWARRLERAGASVVYGLANLKTHAKACLIVRREADGIRRYAHLGTGNYNESTARLYSDLGLLTCDEDMTSDISALFNMMTGFSRPSGLKKLTIAPLYLRKELLRLIHREARRGREGAPCGITAKMNSLADDELIEALYEASRAGVPIRLNIRGICRLVPGVPGRSETIEVVSIVDRFLEHSRVFQFRNGGEDEVYLASADWMSRNLDRRVETMFPIEDAGLRDEVIEILDVYFRDDVKSWTLHADGTYTRRRPGAEPFRAQEYLWNKSFDKAQRLKKSQQRELRPRRPEMD